MTLEHLSLYASTKLKNARNSVMCLQAEENVHPKLPEIPEKRTAHNERVWAYHSGDLVKNEQVLKSNLGIIFLYLFPDAILTSRARWKPQNLQGFTRNHMQRHG